MGMFVAAEYVWDAYPGLRVGRLYSGAGDLGRHPRGETHVVSGPDEVETACGLLRGEFPYEFPPTVSLDDARPCLRCHVAPSR